MLLSDPNAHFTLGISAMRTPSYIKDQFLEVAGFLDAFILVLCYMAPVFRLVSMIVLEKETNTREGMKMMGLKDSAYWLSMLIYYFIIFVVIALLLTGISMGCIYHYSNWFLMFLFYLMYGLSVFSFSIFLSAFFSRARIASIGSAMLYFVSYSIIILVQDPGVSLTNKTLASLLPAVAGSLMGMARVTYESGQYALDFSNAGNIVNNYSFATGFYMLIADFFLYGLLAIYFDNVMPSPTGARQPLNYFLKLDYWTGRGTEERKVKPKSQKTERDDEVVINAKNDKEDINAEREDELLIYPNEYFEPVGDELKEQERNNQCMKIRNLTKTFGDKNAVNNFSVNMYKGQIFALLGPNGAGKTTTLSMLTGLLPATSGSCSFAGFSVFEHMAKTREKLGVCPQHDVLFENLTPREHLEIFAAFKGRADNEQIKKDVDEILTDIELKDCDDMVACNLSGGQRRKLSIGIAFIGNSDIIFLDEPTSGIDISARKKVWVMLKKYKAAKVIILTTHYMEEAEELGDRIGIMASGTMKCVGPPLFLKNAFHAGHNLIIVKEEMKPDEDKKAQEEITEFIITDLPKARFRRVAGKEVTYDLPASESKKFKEFFTKLDANIEKLKIKSYGMTTNSLEDIFLQVAKEDINEKGEAGIIAEKMYSASLGKGDVAPSELDKYAVADEPPRDAITVFGEHFKAILIKRLLITWRTIIALANELIIPILLILLGLIFASIPTYYNGDVRWFLPQSYPLPQSVIVNDNNVNTGYSASNYISMLRPGIVGVKMPVSSNNDTANLIQMDQYIFDNQGVSPCRYGSIYLKTMSPQLHKYEAVVFVNISSQDATGAMVALLSEPLLKLATNNSNLVVTFANAPLPLTYEAMSREIANKGNMISNTLVVAFALIPAGVICFVVREREDNLKHQQIISGVSLLAYWTANSVIDILKSLVPCAAGIGLIYAFGIDLPDAWILILVYAFTIIPFTYATSFLFAKENVSQIATLMLHFLCGVVLSPIFTMLNLFDSTRQAAKVLGWILRIIPSFALSYGINNIS